MLTKKRYFKKYAKKTDVVKPSVKRVIRSMIKRQVEPACEMQYLQLRGGTTNLIMRPFYALNLMDFTSMRQIYGTVGSDYSLCNKIQHKKIEFDFLFNCGNEYSNVSMTAYIVSIKKSQNLYGKTTGVLNTLTSGLEYADNDAAPNAGQSFLNPRMWTIHKKKRWESGNNGLATLAGSGTGGDLDLKTVYRWTGSIKTDQKIENTTGNVASLICLQDPATQYYLLVFNDNIGGDAEYPNFFYNIVHSFIVPN